MCVCDKGLSHINVPVCWGYLAIYHIILCDCAGTGKSSIVCAICLGLGGSPRLLGRAKDVRIHHLMIDAINVLMHDNYK